MIRGMVEVKKSAWTSLSRQSKWGNNPRKCGQKPPEGGNTDMTFVAHSQEVSLSFVIPFFLCTHFRYRVPQFVPLSAFPASFPPPSPIDHDHNGNGSKRKGSGRNHKRPRDDVHADKEEGLCRSFLEKRCTYGDGCKFSHDTIGYLARKPAVSE